MIGVALLAGQERSNDLTESALYAALLLVAAHALLQAGLALASGIITSIVHSPSLEAMGGLAKRLPGFSMAVFCLALTAATLPPFAPFVSEWILVQAIVSALNGATLVFSATMVIILSVIGFVAGLALFASIKMYAMVFLAQPRSEAAEAALDPVPGLMMPVVSLAALGLLLGIFSPYVLNQIGAVALVPTGSAVSGIAIDGGVLEPVTLSMTLVGILIVLMCFRYFLSDARQERIADTWGGGQPITPRMEYTATAFSAPIRFFFRFFTRTKKATVVTPVTPSNPWVTRQSLSLLVNKLWHNKLYTPVGKGVMRLASWAGRLHNGSVQFYICLVLLTLFVSLILAL
jgi:NADH:ubiquinone oxidoreductase subunit 5 (subunit L)/multisubunit Na+/H+ antiporter MnhA subunit